MQHDSYYLKLRYEFARQLKGRDILNDAKQEVRELCIKADRVIKEADKVSAQHKRIKRAAKEMHHNLKHMNDQDDNDKPIFTPEGKVIVTICFNHAAPKIQRLIDDDSISFEEFKKMDL